MICAKHKFARLAHTQPLLWACANLAWLTGCDTSTDDRFATVPAFGRVTVANQPQGGIVLQLVPQMDNPIHDTRLRPGAVSKNDGTFELTTYSLGDGAPPGKYHMILFWPPSEEPGAFSPERTSSSTDYKGPPDRLEGKYFDADLSSWEVIVTSQKTDIGTFDIEAPPP